MLLTEYIENCKVKVYYLIVLLSEVTELEVWWVWWSRLWNLFCELNWIGSPQGHNFGLKVGVPIQKENEAPLGPETRGEENGEVVSLLIRLWGL